VKIPLSQDSLGLLDSLCYDEKEAAIKPIRTKGRSDGDQLDRRIRDWFLNNVRLELPPADKAHHGETTFQAAVGLPRIRWDGEELREGAGEGGGWGLSQK